jgi:polysaccharide export outer membrane protein
VKKSIWRSSICVGVLSTARALAGQAPAADLPVPAPEQVAEQSNYIVGPGDSIQVFVWRNPELSVTTIVRPDGKVTTPLVEDIVAVGQTPSGLARLIETRLAEYIRSPQVNVIVTNAQSSFSKVTVIGQVKSPQAVPYQQGMTVLDVVLAVGGLGEFAGGNRAKILRKDADGKQKQIRVRLADLVNKGRIKENVSLQPGDVLMVPESRF